MRSRTGSVLLVALTLSAAAAFADHDVPRRIRVEVQGETAIAYNRATGAKIATWSRIKDFRTEGDVVVLRDRSNLAGAFNVEGKRIAWWERTTDYEVGPTMAVLRDSSQQTLAVNRDGKALARWSRCTDYKLAHHVVVLRDSSRLAIAKSDEDLTLARWHRTTDFAVSDRIVILRDSDRRAIARSHTAKQLADWQRTTKYLAGEGIAALLDSDGNFLASGEEGHVNRGSVRDFELDRDVARIEFTNGRIEYLDLAHLVGTEMLDELQWRAVDGVDTNSPSEEPLLAPWTNSPRVARFAALHPGTLLP